MEITPFNGDYSIKLFFLFFLLKTLTDISDIVIFPKISLCSSQNLNDSFMNLTNLALEFTSLT